MPSVLGIPSKLSSLDIPMSAVTEGHIGGELSLANLEKCNSAMDHEIGKVAAWDVEATLTGDDLDQILEKRPLPAGNSGDACSPTEVAKEIHDVALVTQEGQDATLTSFGKRVKGEAQQ